MKIIDLTHTISEDMPVYPGTEPPVLKPANTYEKDGFRETLLSLYSHTGTHVDPPAHSVRGSSHPSTRCRFEQFAGKALVIDCTRLAEGEAIRMNELEQAGIEKQRPRISCSFISAGISDGELTAILAITLQ